MTEETNLNDQENVQENQEQPVEAQVEKSETVESTAAPVAEEVKDVEKPLKKEKVDLQDFDWDTIGKKHDNYSGKERKQLEDIYDKTLSSIVEQQVVEGTIVGMNNREVVVNIGFKSDAVVSLNEFRDLPDMKVGDKVDVYVESQENLTGQLILSHKKSKIAQSMGPRERSARKRRDHHRFCEMPHQRRAYCRRVWHRSILTRFTN